LRRPAADRPAIPIPPRKRQRITYNEDEDSEDDEEALETWRRKELGAESGEDALALEGNEEANSGQSANEAGNRQLVLHADFEDDDSEAEDDFVPGEDEESNEDADEADDADEDEVEEQEGQEESATQSANEAGDRQLVLHAHFEDDDSEADDDFVPGEDEESDEDADEADADEDEVEEQDGQEESATNTQAAEEEINASESDLDDVSDGETRTKIRKLHSAFPTSPIAVCRYVLEGSGGNLGKAHDTMSLGFQPVKPASAITETSKATPSVPKTRSKKRKAEEPAAPAEEDPDSMQVEAAETADSLLLEHYDRNGLPPGSISSGKALSIMAEAIQNSPGRSRPTSGRPNSALSNKKLRFLDEGLANGFTSTPAIDRQSLTDDSEDESGDSESDSSSVSDEGSSEEDSSSDEGEENAKDSDNSSSDDEERSAKAPNGSSRVETMKDAESSESSSSGSDSDSDSDSSSDDEERSAKAPNGSSRVETMKDAEGSETSSSGSDSDSDSDSSSDDDAPEEISNKPVSANSAQSVTVSTDTLPPKTAQRMPVPRGCGKKSTAARNARRRQANALNRLKEKGILPAGTTSAEFSQLSDINNSSSPEEASAALEAIRSAKIAEKTNDALDKSKEFQARRQALLASLEAGGIEIGPELSKGPSPNVSRASSTRAQISTAKPEPSPPQRSIDDQQEVSKTFPTAPETHQASPSNDASQIPSKPAGIQASVQSSKPATSAEADSQAAIPNASAIDPKSTTPASESAPSSVASRRTKLDLGAGRRMLFGALGIKAPKSKKDEEKVRGDLMKDVRPILAPKPAEKAPEEEDEDVEDQDDDAWRDKITYRAVECCYDGIELSEPPFPFVQRWDPQQQGGWQQNGKNGGKGKKNQRDESQYYQDAGRPSKRQKQRKGKYKYAEQQEYLDASYEPSYQEDSLVESEAPTQETRPPADEIELEVDQQLMDDLNEEVSAQVSQGPEDLAPLPEDPKSLADLQDGQAKPGMTIAFKELTMSEETKWQPEISAYRTAVVNTILDRGELQLTLALRDRVNAERFYDAETGERLYGKFDMPDQDEDEDEQEDDGIRNLTFNELVEPKIVQAAPADLGTEYSQTNEIEMPKGTSSDSQTLSHEHENEARDTQFSRVMETPLNSDASVSNLQESIQESVSDSPEPDAQRENQESNRGPTTPIAQQPTPETDEQTPKHTGVERPAKITVASQSQENSAAAVNKGKGKEPAEEDAAEQHADIPERELTSAADSDASVLQVSTSARQKISQITKDAGFRSSVPSSVIKDIRPTGMESPGDAQVFEKLMKDMTEIESSPPYSPKFHGLNASSPIRKLRQGSEGRQPSSSPPGVQSSWETVDTDAASSPPLQEENESSWQTIDPEDPLGPPGSVPLKPVPEAQPAKKFNFEKLGKAQSMWEALQPKNRKAKVDSPGSSRASPGPSAGLDGANEKDSNTPIQYPKLSVRSSFTSQVSDHGRQPDIDFDDSAMVSTDTTKVAAVEDDTFLNHPDDAIQNLSQNYRHTNRLSSNHEQQADESASDESCDSDDVDEPIAPRKSAAIGSPQSRSKTPDVLQGSPSSDESFPSLHEVLSQRDTTREKTTPVRPKPARPIKVGKGNKKANYDGFELSDDGDTTPKASQKNSQKSKSEQSLPSASQMRKSPRHSKVRGSQPQASQRRASQSPPQFTSTQQSQVVDLTLSSSDVEQSDHEVVTSEAEEQPRRIRKFALGADDDDEFLGETFGWVPKKSSSQKLARTRRQTGTGLRASSQSSLNTSSSRRKTSSRF
jgi:hypothetical protein